MRFSTLYISWPSYVTTWNHHNLRHLRTETATANCFNFHLELNASYSSTLCWSWGVASYETLNKFSHFLNSNLRQKFIFFNRSLPWRCRPDCLRSLILNDPVILSHRRSTTVSPSFCPEKSFMTLEFGLSQRTNEVPFSTFIFEWLAYNNGGSGKSNLE